MGPWLTIREVAALADRSGEWVHQRIRDGTFRCRRQGRRVYVYRDDVGIWIGEEIDALRERMYHLTDSLEAMISA